MLTRSRSLGKRRYACVLLAFLVALFVPCSGCNQNDDPGRHPLGLDNGNEQARLPQHYQGMVLQLYEQEYEKACTTLLAVKGEILLYSDEADYFACSDLVAALERELGGSVSIEPALACAGLLGAGRSATVWGIALEPMQSDLAEAIPIKYCGSRGEAPADRPAIILSSSVAGIASGKIMGAVTTLRTLAFVDGHSRKGAIDVTVTGVFWANAAAGGDLVLVDYAVLHRLLFDMPHPQQCAWIRISLPGQTPHPKTEASILAEVRRVVGEYRSANPDAPRLVARRSSEEYADVLEQWKAQLDDVKGVLPRCIPPAAPRDAALTRPAETETSVTGPLGVSCRGEGTPAAERASAEEPVTRPSVARPLGIPYDAKEAVIVDTPPARILAAAATCADRRRIVTVEVPGPPSSRTVQLPRRCLEAPHAEGRVYAVLRAVGEWTAAGPAGMQGTMGDPLSGSWEWRPDGRPVLQEHAGAKAVNWDVVRAHLPFEQTPLKLQFRHAGVPRVEIVAAPIVRRLEADIVFEDGQGRQRLLGTFTDFREHGVMYVHMGYRGYREARE